MPDWSTTSHLVERARQIFEAVSSGDFDALVRLSAPDASYEPVTMGVTFDGVAIREFLEDMWERTRVQCDVHGHRPRPRRRRTAC